MGNKAIHSYIPRASLFAALGVIFPVFFHLLGLGSIFLPMFLPITMGAFLLPWKLAASIAVVTPMISFAISGMPPLFPPILPLMMVELLLISIIASILFFHKKNSLWLSLVAAILVDRIVLFIFVYWFAPLLGFPPRVFSIATVVHGIPGIVLMLVVIPLTMRFLTQKYPHILSNQVGDED
ncbi:MAG: ECF transporter S component [Calditrichia bacterium]